MSYTIYQGLKYEGNNLMQELLDYTSKLKTYEGDKGVGLNLIPKLQLLEEGDKNKEKIRYRKDFNSRDSSILYSYNADLEVRVFSNGQVFPLTTNTKIYEDLLLIEGMTEYGYWDNVDKPEDISEDEWKNRRKDWEECLESNYLTIVVNKEEITLNELGEL